MAMCQQQQQEDENVFSNSSKILSTCQQHEDKTASATATANEIVSATATENEIVSATT